jgi:hypothetical protein
MLTSASTAMIVTMAVFMVISGFSVVLRLYLRRRKRVTLKADDYFVIAAWVSLDLYFAHISLILIVSNRSSLQPWLSPTSSGCLSVGLACPSNDLMMRRPRDF